MRIGYFADGPWSHLALEKILSNSMFSLAFICARFDNPDPILKNKAEEKNIPFVIHEDINSSEFISLVDEYACDIFVSMSFNQIFRSEILSKTPIGIINCHAGKLPFYRGRNILNWALINDENEFAVTVHYVDEGVDTGDIILQKSYPITDEDDYSTLLSRAHQYCAEVLYEALNKISHGESERVCQKDIHPVGFYCTQRKVGDEKLDWNQVSRQVFNFVRAICLPGPQAITFNDKEEVKINKVEIIPDAPKYKGIPGAVLSIDSRGLIVKTADSFVRVTEWSSTKKIRVGDRLI